MLIVFVTEVRLPKFTNSLSWPNRNCMRPTLAFFLRFSTQVGWVLNSWHVFSDLFGGDYNVAGLKCLLHHHVVFNRTIKQTVSCWCVSHYTFHPVNAKIGKHHPTDDCKQVGDPKWWLEYLDIQSYPLRRCFRCVLGVQVPCHVFGCLGNTHNEYCNQLLVHWYLMLWFIYMGSLGLQL